MKSILKTVALTLLVALAAVPLTLPTAFAQEASKLELAGGKLIMKAPAPWKKGEPKSSMIEHEFLAPIDAKEEETARITIMSAGGSIDANIDRWYGQFEQPDGKPTKEKAKTEKFDVAGNTVHWVDIPGNFKETMGGGPFSGGKTVVRENYRMLGAIIVSKDQRQVFIKMTGPADVVEKLSDSFKKSLKELESK